MTKQKKTTERVTKIGIIARKNLDFLVEFPDATMDVDYFACSNVIFLKKSVRCDCRPRNKRCLLRHSDLKIAH